jgi:hypothetical protein
MNAARTYLRSGHQHWAYAVWVDGLPDLWVQRNFPLDRWATGYLYHREILALRELVTTAGGGDPFQALGSPGQLLLDLQDPSGYISGLLAAGAQTQLAAAVDAADVTLTVEDASVLPASGTVWLSGEPVKYTGKAGNNLTGCTRAYLSDESAGDYPELPDGTLPPYRVGTTPQYLEGRTVHVWAVAVDPTGAALHEWSDAQKIWKGTITGVPYSLTGRIWQIECAGLERRLQPPLPLGQTEAHLPGALPAGPDGMCPILITPAANLLEVSIYEWVVGGNGMQGILRTTLPTGVLTRGRWMAAWADIISQLETQTGGTISWYQTDKTKYWEYVEMVVPGSGGTGSTIGYSVFSQHGPRSVWAQLGVPDGKCIGGNWYIPTYTMGYGTPHSVYIPSTSDVPFVSAQACDWPAPGFAKIEGYDTIEYTTIDEIGTYGEGRLYLASGCSRGADGTPPGTYRVSSDPNQQDTQTEGPRVVSAAMLYGQSAGLASVHALDDMRLPSIWTDTETVGLTVDGSATGPRAAVLTAATSLARVVSDLLALEGMTLAPGMTASGDYSLVWRRTGVVHPNPRAVAVDWDRQANIQSGLGQVVNQLTVTCSGGATQATDLPSLSLVRAVQSKTLESFLPASLAGLMRAGVAAYALLRRWGRPHLVLRVWLGPEYRDLVPGDPVSLTLPDGTARTWWVGQVTACWLGGQGHCQVLLHEALSYSCRWYAPCAIIESVAGPDLTCYQHGFSSPGAESLIWPGSETTDVEWFSVGDAVRLYDVSDGSTWDTTVTGVDRATHTLSVAAATGAADGIRVTLLDYASSTATSQSYYHFIRAAGSIYGEWGA